MKAKNRTAKKTDSATGDIGGIPTLMAGGTPLPAPVFCLLGNQAMRDNVVASLYAHGIGAFAVRSPIGVGACRQTDDTIETMVERMVNVARLAPDSRLMADCSFFPAEEWMLENPNEGFISADSRVMVTGKCGLVAPRAKLRVPGPSIRDVKTKTLYGEDPRSIYGQRRVSPFSELFARQSVISIRKLVRALKANGIMERLSGFFIGCYNCGEWNPGLPAPDYGRAGVLGFRKYLQLKYRNDRALQEAWRDPFVTLRNVLPPREHAVLDITPMRVESARHADYQAAKARALAEQLLVMARGVKKNNPCWVTGGFFPGAGRHHSDWLRAARDPAIDFLATPIAYENRGPGCGVGSQCPFYDGFSALGKVWFHELDTRTLIAGKDNERYGRAHTIAESVGLLWRDAGQMLIRGHHGWWLDFGNRRLRQHGQDGAPPYSWHLEPEFLQFHSRFSELWRKVEKLDRRPFDEIKVFIPSEAARYHQILAPIDFQWHTEWTLLGAPVQWDVLENLLEGRSKLGKLNIIYGAERLTSAMLSQLKRSLQGKKSFVVWLGGAGLFEDGCYLDEYRAESIIPVQQRFRLLDELMKGDEVPVTEALPAPEAIRLLGISRKDNLGQHNRMYTSGFSYYSEKLNVPMKKIRLGWKLEITDPNVIPIARLKTDDSLVAAMKKDENGMTHVVYNLPILNTSLLRALALKAGCHLFARRDDVIYASRGLLLLHAAYSGIHRLCFPRKSRVFDMISDKPVATGIRQLSLKLKRGETRLYSWK